MVSKDVSIASPDATAATEIATFSGTWCGQWFGERTNTLMADQLIAVEMITQSSAQVAYIGVGLWGHLAGQRWSYRLTAELVDGALRFKLPQGTIVTAKMSQDGTLSARGVSPGGAWVARMSKVGR